MFMRKLSFVTLVILFYVEATQAEVSLENKILGAYFGTLVSDSLCLGSHYEYSAESIKKAYGGKVIDKYYGPGEKMNGSTHGIGWGRRNYHPGMKAGDQTDYGLYNVLTLEYLSSRKDKTSPVDLQKLLPMWERRVSNNWGAWVCTMTRTTLQQVRQGASVDRLGGFSNAMSMRSAAAHAVWKDEDSIVNAAMKFMFTHRNEEALGGAKFFAKVAHRIIHQNLSPREAIDSVTFESPKWLQDMVETAIAKFEEATNMDSALSKEEFVDDLAMTSMARLWDVGKSEPIRVGKASPTEGVLPGSIYIILKYADDFMAAITANAMVGGDNASRGTNIGLVLGAYHGIDAIPRQFKESLNQFKRCKKMLMTLPLLKGTVSKSSNEL
eukprot:g11981.t1